MVLLLDDKVEPGIQVDIQMVVLAEGRKGQLVVAAEPVHLVFYESLLCL